MLKQAVKQAVNSLGLEVKRMQPRHPEPPASSRARDLLRAMWPVTTDYPLRRFGGSEDGAYLIPDDLDGIAALFSPGIAEVSVFEGEMAARGMRCYLADASVEGPTESNPAFTFDKKFLGLSSEGDHIRLDDWVDRYEPGDHDLMLQMDIEGAEWTVLSSMSDQLLSRFRIIAIELHSMFLLCDQFGEQIIIDVMQRLLKTHHLVHNHPNNWMPLHRRAGLDVPEVIEVTFLRKDRSEQRGYATQFPHPLDVVNNRQGPDMILPPAWHG